MLLNIALHVIRVFDTKTSIILTNTNTRLFPFILQKMKLFQLQYTSVQGDKSYMRQIQTAILDNLGKIVELLEFDDEVKKFSCNKTFQRKTACLIQDLSPCIYCNTTH